MLVTLIHFSALNIISESYPLTVYCVLSMLSIVNPGVRFREMGEIISRHASMSGFSVVMELLLFVNL